MAIMVSTAVLISASGSGTLAGPKDDAFAVIQNWATAFNASDIDKIIAAYTPEASVHGTTANSLAVGKDALRAYFGPAARSRNQVKLAQDGSEATTMLGDGQVVVAGFYEFSGTRPDGQAFTAPARYTFVLVKQDGAWLIAHQHSSPRARPAQ
ncbi:SgcJ/EcaC family oxidoreductase [Bosea caraganae]|nr:SgcJ/EcaC family oxidoreductase [Bosea caraganae]